MTIENNPPPWANSRTGRGRRPTIPSVCTSSRFGRPANDIARPGRGHGPIVSRFDSER